MIKVELASAIALPGAIRPEHRRVLHKDRGAPKKEHGDGTQPKRTERPGVGVGTNRGNSDLEKEKQKERDEGKGGLPPLPKHAAESSLLNSQAKAVATCGTGLSSCSAAKQSLG